MNNITGEPIPGQTSDETSDTLPPVIQRVLEVGQLIPKGNRYSAEFNQAREKLTEDLIDILAEASKLRPEEKIDFAIKFIPLVDWEYHWDTGLDPEKQHKEDMSLLRQTALKAFLMDIPTEILDDNTVNALFETEAANKPNQYRNLTGLRHFLVASIATMPFERAKQFMDRLNPYFGYDTNPQVSKYAAQTGIGEQVFVMRNWTVEEAMPYVNAMIDSDLKNHGENLKTIAKAIENWSQKDQEYVIRKSLNKSGLEGLYTDGLFRVVKLWSPEQAKPLLRELLAWSWGEGRGQGTSYWDRNYGSLAMAMSNWSQGELDAFLTDENNTRFLRDVVYHYEQNYRGDPKYKHSFEEEYSRVLNTFYVAILRERDGDFTEEMIRWLQQNIKYESGQQSIFAGRIILKHIELFSPDLVSALILSRSDSSIKDTIDAIAALPKQEQVRFLKPIADLFMTDDLGYNYNEDFKFKIPVSRAFQKIISGWELGNVDKLVTELLSRGRVSYKRYDPNRNENSQAPNIANAFRLLSYRDQITDLGFIKQILKYSIADPESDEGKKASEIVGRIVRNEETELVVIEAAGEAIANQYVSLSEKSVRRALEIGDKYGLVELVKFQDRLPTYIQSLIHSFEIKDLHDLTYFIAANFDYSLLLSSAPDQSTLLTEEDIAQISNLHISLLESEIVKRFGINLLDLQSDEDYQKVFNVLRKEAKEWQDNQSIAEPFRKGAEVFGYRRMFAYLDRKDTTEQFLGSEFRLSLTRHDGLHAFEDILHLYEISDLTRDQFYGQILSHVMHDDAVYNAGTAHHQLNEIASTLATDFAKNLALAKEFSDIEGIGELAELFSTPDQIFASWNSLKRYSKLTQLLGEREVLESLQTIENQTLRKYVTHLAFHRDSKVDMQAALEFATNPRAFLEREASHTPQDVQDRKKPSNYIDVWNMDMTAEELIEALVEGKMDALSVFTPMEITYTVIVDEEASRPQELLKRALGSRAKEGVSAVPGEARDVKKLFSEVGRLLKPHGVSVQQYLAGGVLPDASKHEVEQQLFSFLFNDQFGMRRSAVKTQTYVAKIGRKSDPDMVLAGDDTVNCMPFGDGKTTVYTFNPNTAQFVLQVVRPDNKRRTIAQSVLTKDLDIKKAIPQVIEQLSEEGGHLADILPEDALVRQDAYIACDNVEVAPNFTDQSRVITVLYRDFFRQYLAHFAREQHLQSSRVIVGEGYSDALNELPEILNTFAPQAPVSYSDKTGQDVRILEMDGSDPYVILQSSTVVDELPEKPLEASVGIAGTELLTFEHALQVAYIEGKAYADNESLMQYLHNMENGLIAKDINNAAKGRSNMSLAYRDKTGKMQGYLLAYHGTITNIYPDPDDDEEYADHLLGTEAIYISDTAVADKSSVAGARAGTALVQGFVQLYKQNYIDKRNLVPILAQAREETSFRLIQRKLEELTKEAGVSFELEELPTYQAGNSTMHPVIIRPKK